MNIKCGSCGKSIVVPDDLVAGQHVRCPYCNEKTAFDKPTRIALPDCFEVKRHSRAKIDELKRKHEQANVVADLPPEAQKPTLAIRRPAQEAKDREQLNAAAAAVDARIRKAERKRRIARIKKAVGSWLSIAALVALAWIGYTIWKMARRREMPTYLPEQVSQIISNAVEKVNEEIAK